jgi:transposase
MEGLLLSNRQRDRLRRAWRTTDDAALCRRIAAVLDVDGGEPMARVAERFGISRRSVSNWIDRVAEGTGPEVLIDRPRSGRPRIWTGEIQDLVRECLKWQPDSLGYQAVGWTVPLLQDLLSEWKGVVVSADTVRRHLHQLGDTWKRPRYVLDPDPEREKKSPNSSYCSEFAVADGVAFRG